MTNENNENNADRADAPDLPSAIAYYEQALTALAAAKPAPSLAQILAVLTARDTVEDSLQATSQAPADLLARVIELDEKLQSFADAISVNNQLARCRQSLNPPKTAWWWFLSPPAPRLPKLPKWTSFDWLWNGLTVVSLVFATTFATNTINAFSRDGMDLLQIFGTISQGAGLVLVSGGALTNKGRRTIKNILRSLNIPPALHSETTFVFSIVVLLATYIVNQALPGLGNFYYQQGNQFYNQGELLLARRSYQEALNFDPKNSQISVALGNIHETLQHYDKAANHYQPGLFEGNPASFNGVGRTTLRQAQSKEDLFQAETYFRLALSEPSVDGNLKAELHTNLGLALLKQAKDLELNAEKVQRLRQDAEQNFRKAIRLEKTLPQLAPGAGMAYCYLASLLQQDATNPEMQKQAMQQWQLCADNALPTTVSQYQDIITEGPPQIVGKVSTRSIVSEDPTVMQRQQP